MALNLGVASDNTITATTASGIPVIYDGVSGERANLGGAGATVRLASWFQRSHPATNRMMHYGVFKVGARTAYVLVVTIDLSTGKEQWENKIALRKYQSVVSSQSPIAGEGSPQPAGSQPPTKKTNWTPIIVTTLVIVGFGVGIYFTSKRANRTVTLRS